MSDKTGLPTIMTNFGKIENPNQQQQNQYNRAADQVREILIEKMKQVAPNDLSLVQGDAPLTFVPAQSNNKNYLLVQLEDTSYFIINDDNRVLSPKNEADKKIIQDIEKQVFGEIKTKSVSSNKDLDNLLSNVGFNSGERYQASEVEATSRNNSINAKPVSRDFGVV